MDHPAINQDDLDAVDPQWLADMLALAAQGKTPEIDQRADSTLVQPSRKMWRHLH
jgi:hypothetical protein